MKLDLTRFASAWKIIAACCQVWVGLALLGVVPGMSNTDGWFARILGPVLLLAGLIQLINGVRKRPG